MTVLGFYPVWASNADSKVEDAAPDKRELGWTPVEVAITENINFNNKSLMDKLNDIIELYVDLSVDSIFYAIQTLEDDVLLEFGTSGDSGFLYSTSDASHPQFRVGVPATNKALAVCEQADVGLDLLQGSVSESSLHVFGSDVSDWTSLNSTGTFGSGKFGYIDNSGGYLRLKTTALTVVGTGSSSHSLGANDLSVTGKLEMKENLYIDDNSGHTNGLTVTGSTIVTGELAYKPVVIDDSYGISTPFNPATADQWVVSCDGNGNNVYIEITTQETSGQLLTIQNLSSSGNIVMTWTGSALSDDQSNLEDPYESRTWRYSGATGAWMVVGSFS